MLFIKNILWIKLGVLILMLYDKCMKKYYWMNRKCLKENEM